MHPLLLGKKENVKTILFVKLSTVTLFRTPPLVELSSMKSNRNVLFAFKNKGKIDSENIGRFLLTHQKSNYEWDKKNWSLIEEEQ